MANPGPPPIVNVDITCRECGHSELRSFRAWVGDRVSMRCRGYRCNAPMTVIIEP